MKFQPLHWMNYAKRVSIFQRNRGIYISMKFQFVRGIYISIFALIMDKLSQVIRCHLWMVPLRIFSIILLEYVSFENFSKKWVHIFEYSCLKRKNCQFLQHEQF